MIALAGMKPEPYLVVGLAAALLVIPSVALLAQDEPSFDAVIDATVRVQAKSTGKNGTGWVVEGSNAADRAGAAVIVTSLNLVEDSSSIVIREPKTGDAHDATILGVDRDRNLAFLEVKDIVAEPIPLSLTAPKPGQSVWGTGYNDAADQAEGDDKLAANSTIKGGRLGREYRGPISTEARADMNQIEHDAPMFRGFEGGPLVNRCGEAIGINMKSGMTKLPRSQLLIAPGATTINALKADEIIAAAKTLQVNFKPSDGTCGAETAAAPPPTVAPSAINPDGGATKAEGSNRAVVWLMANLPLVGMLLIGLIVAAFGLYMMTRKRPVESYGMRDPVTPNTPVSRHALETSVDPEGGTTLVAATVAPTVRELELRLNGRGPGGEPIDVRLAGSALKTKPVMAGVGSNADIRIPDNRSDHKVSRLHARLAFDGTNFTVEDNKSLNGTRVSGGKLEAHHPQTLVHGDTLSLADIDLKVSIT